MSIPLAVGAPYLGERKNKQYLTGCVAKLLHNKAEYLEIFSYLIYTLLGDYERALTILRRSTKN